MSDGMLIEKVKEFQEVVGSIAKTPKRHGKILDALMNDFELRRQRASPSTILIDFLKRKLGPNEGIVINSVFFSHMFDVLPTRSILSVLSKQLEYSDLYMVPIWQGDNALLVLFHKNSGTALEYSTKIQQALNSTPPDDRYLLTITNIKVSQEIAKKENITPKAIVDALHVMTDTEAFYVGEAIVFTLKIDPKAVTALAEKAGYKVTVLQREKIDDPTENEDYNYFEKFIGLVISRTDEGIQMGLKHHKFMAQMEKEVFTEDEDDDYDSEQEAKFHSHHLIGNG